MSGRGDPGIEKGKAVSGVRCSAFVGESCLMECAVEPVTGAIAGEHPPSAIGSVRGRSEAHD